MDQRLVRPESRDERVGGRRVLAVPAGAPHGDAHYQVDGETLFHLRHGYVGSTDLLTRTDAGSDFAADTSVRKEGTDPATGGRYLEEVVFEVVHEQSLRDVTDRAERLVRRGIRRMFAVFVKRAEVAEWAPEAGAFRALPADGAIEDPCFVRPLPVRALLDRAAGRDAVALALLEEKNSVLEQARERARLGGVDEGRREGLAEGRREGLAEGRREGLAEGRREAIEQLCAVLGIDVGEARRAALAGMDAGALASFAERIGRGRRWPS